MILKFCHSDRGPHSVTDCSCCTSSLVQSQPGYRRSNFSGVFIYIGFISSILSWFLCFRTNHSILSFLASCSPSPWISWFYRYFSYFISVVLFPSWRVQIYFVIPQYISYPIPLIISTAFLCTFSSSTVCFLRREEGQRARDGCNFGLYGSIVVLFPMPFLIILNTEFAFWEYLLMF